MAAATPADIETSLLRELTVAEAQYAPALLERAEGLLVTRIADLAERTSTDAHFHDLVVATEAEAVARVLRNPEAIKQESEGNYSYAFNYRVASGLLDILPAEWERLGAGQKAGSIAPIVDSYITQRAQLTNAEAFERDLL